MINMRFTKVTYCLLSQSKNGDTWIFTYVAEEVLEVVASGVVIGIQDSGVQVLLFMISLPVVEL